MIFLIVSAGAMGIWFCIGYYAGKNIQQNRMLPYLKKHKFQASSDWADGCKVCGSFEWVKEVHK